MNCPSVGAQRDRTQPLFPERHEALAGRVKVRQKNWTRHEQESVSMGRTIDSKSENSKQKIGEQTSEGLVINVPGRRPCE